MRKATDEQLRDWGWEWALRYDGRLMAVTVSAIDARNWTLEGIGEVIYLRETPATQEATDD